MHQWGNRTNRGALEIEFSVCMNSCLRHQRLISLVSGVDDILSECLCSCLEPLAKSEKDTRIELQTQSWI